MLTPSLEDYLEESYRHLEAHGIVRPKDLATRLHVSMPSVTKALQKLSEQGFVVYRSRKDVTLTGKGIDVGRYLVSRNRVLQDFLRVIGSTLNIESEVEAMEHYLSPETIDRIAFLTQFLMQPGQEQEFRRLWESARQTEMCTRP